MSTECVIPGRTTLALSIGMILNYSRYHGPWAGREELCAKKARQRGGTARAAVRPRTSGLGLLAPDPDLRPEARGLRSFRRTSHLHRGEVLVASIGPIMLGALVKNDPTFGADPSQLAEQAL